MRPRLLSPKKETTLRLVAVGLWRAVDFLVELKADPDPAGETLLFGPVPCTRGVFAIDKVPVRFWIGGAKSREAGMSVPLDANGTAVVDLPF